MQRKDIYHLCCLVWCRTLDFSDVSFLTLNYEFQVTKSSRDSDLTRGLLIGGIFDYDKHLAGSKEESSNRHNIVTIGGISGNHSVLAVEVMGENTFYYSVVLRTTILSFSASMAKTKICYAVGAGLGMRPISSSIKREQYNFHFI